ncbi:histidine phosphatase family protein [Paenibacillus chungangensis]|uniref:Histidine phosphatase family protein n=1 Tax=Paenibacillus chungangensis TaxID=696535 RepID=A0ABW3HMM8_9BACL
MDLIVIRHGQSVGNTFPDDVDVPDSPLTKLGMEQAQFAKECLKNSGIDCIISSPLIRAITTAQPLANELNLPINVWLNTHEVRSHPSHRGHTKEYLLNNYPEICFHEKVDEEGWFYLGEETGEHAMIRTKQVVEQLLAKYSGKRVALFAHGGFNSFLLLSTLGMDYRKPSRFRQNNTTFCWLSFREDETMVNYFGEMQKINWSS